METSVVNVQSAVISNYEGYDVFAQYDQSGLNPEQKIYLGKRENYDNHGNYDNTDNSLVYISDNRKMFSFLYGNGWTVSQQEFIDNGAFTAEDYAEYAELKEGVLKQFEELRIREVKFDIDLYIPDSGVAFQYPQWTDNRFDIRPLAAKLAVRRDYCLNSIGNVPERANVWRARFDELRSAIEILQEEDSPALLLTERRAYCLALSHENNRVGMEDMAQEWMGRFEELRDLMEFLEREEARNPGSLEKMRESSQTQQTQRLFVDMDGTLTVFTPQAGMEPLYEEGYFLNLPPHQNVIDAVKYIIENHPEIEVNILSAYLTDSQYALNEKHEWVDKYIPEIDREHRIFVPNGSDKKEWINGLRPDDYLLDDYTINLMKWSPGNGIKLLNAINHTKGTWQGDRIRFDREPKDLATGIVAIMQGREHIYDKKIERGVAMDNRERQFLQELAKYDFLRGEDDRSEIFRAYEQLSSATNPAAREVYQAELDRLEADFDRELNGYEDTGRTGNTGAQEHGNVPCEVGQILYGFAYPGMGIVTVMEETVESVTLGEEGYNIETDAAFYSPEDLGRTIFLSREEAEKALDSRGNLREEDVSNQHNENGSTRFLALTTEYIGRKDASHEIAYNQELTQQDASYYKTNRNDFLELMYKKLGNVGAQPSDYYGHSPSVGDTFVVITPEGIESYYVDSFGYEQETDIDRVITQTQLKMALLGMTVREELALLEDINQYALTYGNENFYDAVEAETMERLDYLHDNYTPVFNLAQIREVTENEQDKLQVLYHWEDNNNVANPIVGIYDGYIYHIDNSIIESVMPSYRFTNGRYVYDDARITAGQRLTEMINRRFERAAQELSQNNHFLYRNHASPRPLGENGEYGFFVQRYERSEDSPGIIPRDIVYVGNAQMVIDITNHLNAQSEYGEWLAENIDMRRQLGLPALMGDEAGDKYAVSEETERMREELAERIVTVTRAMEAAGYQLDSFESTPTRSVFNGDYGVRMEFNTVYEAEEWLDGVVFDDPEISDAVEKIMHPDRFVTNEEKQRVAIESTEDYTEPGFHQELVDVDIQNEDGSYGRMENMYRIVYINENGRLEAFDNRIYLNEEDARNTVERRPELKLMPYDDLVNEAARIMIHRPQERDMVENATISFFVAESMEFHSLGEFHEGLTLQEAFEIYDSIPSERFNGGKGIGFDLQDGSMYAGQVDLLYGNELQEDVINGIEHFRNSSLVQQAIADCKAELDRRSGITQEQPSSFIAQYYVVEDLQKQGALDVRRYSGLDDALAAYAALPADKMKALGIENNNPLPGSLDFVQCRNGVDTLVRDYQTAPGWDNPEVGDVVDRLTEYINQNQTQELPHREDGSPAPALITVEAIENRIAEITATQREMYDLQYRSGIMVDRMEMSRLEAERTELQKVLRVVSEYDLNAVWDELDRRFGDYSDEARGTEGIEAFEYYVLARAERVLQEQDAVLNERVRLSEKILDDWEKNNPGSPDFSESVYSNIREIVRNKDIPIEEMEERIREEIGERRAGMEINSHYAGGEGYRFYYDNEDNAQERERLVNEEWWHQFWGSDEQGLNGGTWVLYRNVSDLPEWLQDYARQQEQYQAPQTRYYEPELDLDATAEELFVQARNGYFFQSPETLSKIQEILTGEGMTDEAFYVGVLKEIKEDRPANKTYYVSSFKKDILDGVQPEEVMLSETLHLNVYHDRDVILVTLHEDGEIGSDGATVIPTDEFLNYSGEEFVQLVNGVHYYNMVEEERPDEWEMSLEYGWADRDAIREELYERGYDVDDAILAAGMGEYVDIDHFNDTETLGSKESIATFIENKYLLDNPISNTLDWFYDRPDMNEILWVSYNPESSAGGQYMVQHIDYDLIIDTAKEAESQEQFFDILYGKANTYLDDIDCPEFKIQLEFYSNNPPDFTRTFYSEELDAEELDYEGRVAMNWLTQVANARLNRDTKQEILQRYVEIDMDVHGSIQPTTAASIVNDGYFFDVETGRVVKAPGSPEQEVTYSGKESFVKLAERIDNFMYDIDTYSYQDEVGTSLEERSANRADTANMIEENNVSDIIENINVFIEEGIADVADRNEAKDIVYSLAHLDQYEQYYGRDTAPNAAHPIHEFIDEQGRMLEGERIPIVMSKTAGFSDRSIVYHAVYVFEEDNNIPENQREIFPDGTYTDKDFLYMAYDRYVGMSHQNDLSVQPYMERLNDLANKYENPSWTVILSLVAEVYYAQQNGLSEQQIDYMIDRAMEYGFPEEPMRNVRHALEFGFAQEQMNLLESVALPVQGLMIEYMAQGGSMENATALKDAKLEQYYILSSELDSGRMTPEIAESIIQAVNHIMDKEEGRYDFIDREFFTEFFSNMFVDDRAIAPETFMSIATQFAAQNETQNIKLFIENGGGVKNFEPHREEPENAERTAVAAQEEAAPTEPSLSQEKKDPKEVLAEQLKKGVSDVLNSENYKNWLDTSSKLFLNNYSFNNALLVWMQKPDATYTMGYEQWKEYGRNVRAKTDKDEQLGIKIFVPVIAYEKKDGDLWRMISNNLKSQIAKDPSLEQAAYRIGMSKLEITMNRNNLYGLRIAGKEQGLRTEKQMQDLIKHSVIGKVPMYYGVGNVFDVKDTVVPEYLWVKKGFTKDEVVRDENGKAVKNKKGEYKIVNTPERQAKFNPTLDMSVKEIESEKANLLYEVLKDVSVRNGIPVYERDRSEDDVLKSADGYFSRQFSDENPKGFIVMPTDLEPTKAVSVLLHEMGHSDMHGDLDKLAKTMGEDNIPSYMREVQAESVAYVVGKNFGIETEMSSFQYIATYTKGFELQALQKSLEVIYSECKKLTNDLKAELESRGLNMDLTDRNAAAMDIESVQTISKAYIKYALEQSDRIVEIENELPHLVEVNQEKDSVMAVIVAQATNIQRQREDVEVIKQSVSELENAGTLKEQQACINKLDAAKDRIENYKQNFNDLSAQFQEITREENTLKDRFVSDPLAAINEMKKTYPQLEQLTDAQVQYLVKSEYVARELAPILRNSPDEFVDKAVDRATQLDKVASKNGIFVEVVFCEQWTDKPIVDAGAMMHPKVADTILKQGEVQIRALKQEAENNNEYFPYSKCKLTVFQAENGSIEKTFKTRIDIGDGCQAGLLDHLKQLSAAKDLTGDFEKATREKGAKDKILYNNAQVNEVEKDVVREGVGAGRVLSEEEWQQVNEKITADMKLEEKRQQSQDRTQSRNNDHMKSK